MDDEKLKEAEKMVEYFGMFCPVASGMLLAILKMDEESRRKFFEKVMEIVEKVVLNERGGQEGGR